MKRLFNRNFFRFAIGFISILLVSFGIAAIVSYIDSAERGMKAGALQQDRQSQ